MSCCGICCGNLGAVCYHGTENAMCITSTTVPTAVCIRFIRKTTRRARHFFHLSWHNGMLHNSCVGLLPITRVCSYRLRLSLILTSLQPLTDNHDGSQSWPIKDAMSCTHVNDVSIVYCLWCVALLSERLKCLTCLADVWTVQAVHQNTSLTCLYDELYVSVTKKIYF